MYVANPIPGTCTHTRPHTHTYTHHMCPGFQLPLPHPAAEHVHLLQDPPASTSTPAAASTTTPASAGTAGAETIAEDSTPTATEAATEAATAPEATTIAPDT